MRKGLISVLVFAAAFLAIADRTSAVQTCLRMSTSCDWPALNPTFGGHISPQKLPANEYAPVTWSVSGKVATNDGTHPSALREVQLDVDKDVRINSRGYPVCEPRLGPPIRRRNPTKAVEKACAEALVGRGKVRIELAFPEQDPIQVSSELLVLNAGVSGGVTKLLIHAFIRTPVPAAIVTVLTISKHGSGLRTISRIPVIASGSGSVLDFKFKLGKTFFFKGKKYGYFEAKCPDDVFKANMKTLLFKNEAKVPGVAAQTVLKGGLAIPCTPQS